jgi:hypothetical protein
LRQVALGVADNLSHVHIIGIREVGTFGLEYLDDATATGVAGGFASSRFWPTLLDSSVPSQRSSSRAVMLTVSLKRSQVAFWSSVMLQPREFP